MEEWRKQRLIGLAGRGIVTGVGRAVEERRRRRALAEERAREERLIEERRAYEREMAAQKQRGVLEQIEAYRAVGTRGRHREPKPSLTR